MLVALWTLLSVLAPPNLAEEPVDYGRDIRPLLSDRCFRCHGPDENERKAKLRLDRSDDALAERRRGAAIVPGNRSASQLYLRTTSDSSRRRMPPRSSGKSLTSDEIELLGRWIDEGAEYRDHWAFEPPSRPPLPAGHARHPIDRFVQSRLAAEGLAASPLADRETLIRRVTLDLTGLPPTLDEIDAFLADTSPSAYQRVVDRLLASPHYGEHFARDWLDAARYADTNGYQYDTERTMWPWRDWVIRALNDNMPFDQFTVEQLAGDLLPDATLDQRIATGFNRNHGITIEGGVILEEYRTEYVIDRVSTTSTVWLGLTAGCARCHDHKFDPLSQKEFYELFAYFNQVDERGMGNDPVVRAPTVEQRERLAAIEAELEAAEGEVRRLAPDLAEAQHEWQERLSASPSIAWTALEPITMTSSGGSQFTRIEDRSLLVGGANSAKDVYDVTYRRPPGEVTALRLEALTHDSLPHRGPGRHANANFVLSEIEVFTSAAEGSLEPVRLAEASADYSQSGYEIAKAIDGTTAGNNGWAVDGPTRREDRVAWFLLRRPLRQAGDLHVRLRHEAGFATHGIGRFRISVGSRKTPSAVRLGPWWNLALIPSDDFETAWSTVFAPERALAQPRELESLAWESRSTHWADGEVHALPGGIGATYLRRAIEARERRAVTLLLGSDDALKVWLNGRLILERQVQRGAALAQDRVTVLLEPGLNELLLKVVNAGGDHAFAFELIEHPGPAPLDVGELAALGGRSPNPQREARLKDFFLDHASPPELRRRVQKRDALTHEKGELEKQFPATLVMRDRASPRETFVLERGQYDHPGESVTAGVPERLAICGFDVAPNRLGLARWLVHPRHPLTARVTVNRFWHHYFSTGLVETLEDFGHQGSWPSHLDLLDWLALELIESGWDVKALQRLIVTSETYRQSSRVSPELRERDPKNHLLARGPRQRLPAEVIRDSALAISGLLVPTIGGPSVYPYQPPGLWMELNNRPGYSRAYPVASGPDLYRRSLYTFWKRTVPHPAMRTFDAPERETCVVRRSRTNTPLQALVLLHDPQLVEAARGLAQRILREAGESTEERISHGFRLATGRPARPREVEILTKLQAGRRQGFAKDSESVHRLLGVGQLPIDESLNPLELATWTEIARAILNLDETITKG